MDAIVILASDCENAETGEIIHLKEGVIVTVLQQDDNGWWKVRSKDNDRTVFFPSGGLKLLDNYEEQINGGEENYKKDHFEQNETRTLPPPPSNNTIRNATTARPLPPLQTPPPIPSHPSPNHLPPFAQQRGGPPRGQRGGPQGARGAPSGGPNRGSPPLRGQNPNAVRGGAHPSPVNAPPSPKTESISPQPRRLPPPPSDTAPSPPINRPLPNINPSPSPSPSSAPSTHPISPPSTSPVNSNAPNNHTLPNNPPQNQSHPPLRSRPPQPGGAPGMGGPPRGGGPSPRGSPSLSQRGAPRTRADSAAIPRIASPLPIRPRTPLSHNPPVHNPLSTNNMNNNNMNNNLNNNTNNNCNGPSNNTPGTGRRLPPPFTKNMNINHNIDDGNSSNGYNLSTSPAHNANNPRIFTMHNYSTAHNDEGLDSPKVREGESEEDDVNNHSDDDSSCQENLSQKINHTEVKQIKVNDRTPLSNEERAKQEQHRRNVVDEIITTEKDYIADLEIVVKVFMQPMVEKSIITKEDCQTLFSNVSVILSVNKEVARLFETRSDEEKDGPLLVGDIFLQMADFFKMYTTYCANQPKALAALDRLSKTPTFADFLQESLLNPETRALTLFSFLIKPIQRICKYPLLLKDLLKHTEPDHPDYDNLDNALTKINEVVEYVNERKRLAENLQKILEIQNQIDSSSGEDLGLVEPSRRFVREMEVCTYDKGRKQSRKMFVFNDLIVLTKQKKSMIGTTLRDHFKGKFYLNEIKIVEMADSDVIIDACEVRPKDLKEKPIIILFPSTNDKRAWLKEVKMLVKEFQKKEAQAAKEKKMKAEEAALGITPSNSDDSIKPPSGLSSSQRIAGISQSNSSSSLSQSMSATSLKDLSANNNFNNNSGISKNIANKPSSGGYMGSPIPPPLKKASTSSSLFGSSKKPKDKDVIKPKKGSQIVPSKSNTQKYKKELVKTLAKKQ